MDNRLHSCIDCYIKKTTIACDKKTAKHLKSILPLTKHLQKETFKDFCDALLKENKKKDFKESFIKVSPEYVLKGDLIRAELPNIFTRIILNKSKFISYLKRISNIPFSARQIESLLTVGENQELIHQLLKNIYLSRHEVVFATFDEEDLFKDPFLNYGVIDIINMLALSRDIFESDRPLTAIKIRYRDQDNLEKRFPTFIDAGWWDKFFPAKEKDSYGKTKSLDKSLPGKPEIVHQNAKMSNLLLSIDILEDKAWN
jgi:hypothetical protein